MIIFIFGGGASLGAILLGILLMCPVGLALSVEDYKEWKYIEAEVEALLLPSDSDYDSIWYDSCAIDYFQKGNYPMAIKAWRKSYECLPNENKLNLIASAYYCQGDLDTAIEFWTVASEVFPDNTLLRKNLASAEKAREQTPSWKPAVTIISEDIQAKEAIQ